MQSFDVLDSPPAQTVEKKAQGTVGVRRKTSPPAQTVEKKAQGTVGVRRKTSPPAQTVENWAMDMPIWEENTA